MESPHAPRVVEAVRLDGDLLITFDYGKCAVYSAASLLYRIFPGPVEVTDEDLDGQD
jgi:hypothetical protein